MPVLLIDGNAPNLEPWLKIEPAVQAALECRQALPAATLRGIPPSEPGNWTLTPARSFTVFGLPVAQVRLFIDPDGELGASYTAGIVSWICVGLGVVAIAVVMISTKVGARKRIR